MLGCNKGPADYKRISESLHMRVLRPDKWIAGVKNSLAQQSPMRYTFGLSNIVCYDFLMFEVSYSPTIQCSRKLFDCQGIPKQVAL